MVTVGADARVVERRLAAGRLRCPPCSARLAGWGHARTAFRRPSEALTGCGVRCLWH
jgi:hypothetical protein